MPRKKITEDDEIDEILEDDPPKKVGRKTTTKGKSIKKESTKGRGRGRKNKKEEEEDDEVASDLSDVDVEDQENQFQEDGENDELLEAKDVNKPTRKPINPKTPIGDLKTEDILSYLIQIGGDNLNPQLKYGALNLLNQLTGRRGRNFQQNNRGRDFNNFRGSYNNTNQRNRGGGGDRGGNRGRGRDNNNNNTYNRGGHHQPDTEIDVYADND